MFFTNLTPFLNVSGALEPFWARFAFFVDILPIFLALACFWHYTAKKHQILIKTDVSGVLEPFWARFAFFFDILPIFLGLACF